MTPLLPDKTVILQERDLALIHTLTEEFRILSRDQIGELFPMGSTTRLNLRLKQLRDAGYLRPDRFQAWEPPLSMAIILGLGQMNYSKIPLRNGSWKRFESRRPSSQRPAWRTGCSSILFISDS